MKTFKVLIQIEPFLAERITINVAESEYDHFKKLVEQGIYVDVKEI